MEEFIDVLRQPDGAVGATDASPYRFEEAECGRICDVRYSYDVTGASAKVTVYPSGSPVKYLKLRFRGDLKLVDKVYGDQWERLGVSAHAEWRSVMPSRAMPWFCYLKSGDRTACYGVKTGADCFAFWQVDTRGITLFLNLCNGNVGTDLKEPLVACEVVQSFSEDGEGTYSFVKAFSRQMCNSPRRPRSPIFGVNNWYWAYGRISAESIETETDYLMRMCDGTKHRPYMIVDDGWQYTRTYGEAAYNGGPWELSNARMGGMSELADGIRSRGAKAGLWFRPLLTLGDLPDEARLVRFERGGAILDPSHPYTLERVERDAARIRSWGYELIKHDFSTIDIFGSDPLTGERHTAEMCRGDRRFYDRTKTTASIVKELYRAIQRGAGDAEVIGCNTVSHLTAGIHSTYRVGGDTSGRSFEWTHRNGTNSVMRLPLNDAFYKVDPDCAAFTDKVDASLNLDYLEMCAITGMTALASVTPGILTDGELERINSIYRTADADEKRFGIVGYDRVAAPEIFASPDGGEVREFDWERAYDGSRVVLSWFQ